MSQLNSQQHDQVQLLATRFKSNMARHPELTWPAINAALIAKPAAIDSLIKMETTGGEPDVIGIDAHSGQFIFVDCCAESPTGRRSLCFDDSALQARKKNPPTGSAQHLASEMGIELLSEHQYRELQTLGEFDRKTSSWVQTPTAIRQLGGALFCDNRYATVFVYHNGADSYYAARGFRGRLLV